MLPAPYDQLQLDPLDGESGLFKVVNISHLSVSLDGTSSPASNAIYYALNHDAPQNHLHWLLSDDYHILIDGGPADYFQFLPDGRSRRLRMGRRLSEGQQLIVPTPAGSWKAVRLSEHAEFLLVGSVVTPAWSPDRVRIGAGTDFIEKYVGSSEWATPSFLKELVGPNFLQS